MLMMSCAAMAQLKPNFRLICGGVYNAFTRERLEKVSVELLDTNYVVIDSIRTSMSDRVMEIRAPWLFDIQGREPQPYIVRFKAEGYEQKTLSVAPVKFKWREMIRFVEDVYLSRELKRDLNEVVVKATKVKIYSKGDTLVYNADAFQFSEGSMLDALISQLPGVKLEDNGRITVNGRLVESLLLNGEDFFKGGNTLVLENLPAYTVNDIKVYEKDGDLSEFTGRKTGDEEYVMDVRLKRDYNEGWLANAEAAQGTEDRYRSRLFASRFTLHSRLTFFANINNLNENRKPGNTGEWSPADLSSGGLRSNKQFGLSYMVNERDGKYKLNGSASYHHYDTDLQHRQSGVNFLPQGDTYTRALHTESYCDTWINTSHEFYFKGKNAYLTIKPNFNWGKWKGGKYDLSGTFNADPEQYANILDSVARPFAGDLMRRIAINRLTKNRYNSGEKTDASIYLNSGITPGIGNDNIYLWANATYSDRRESLFEHYRLDYPAGSGAVDYRNRHTDKSGPVRNMNYNAGAEYWFWLPGNLAIVPSYNFHLHNVTNDYNLYRLERLGGEWAEEGGTVLGALPSMNDYRERTLDHPNSYHSHLNDYSHRATLYLKWEGHPKKGSDAYWYADLRLPLLDVHQELDYRRDQIDTTLTQRTYMFTPRLQIQGRWRKNTRRFSFGYDTNMELTDLASKVDFTSTDDPLNITLSNTSLKNPYKHDFTVGFEVNNNEKQRFFSTRWTYAITQNAIAQGYVYNRQTGVRTYRPENVNGNYYIDGHTNYSFPLDRAKRLTLDTYTYGYFGNSVDLIGVEEGKSPERSTVKSVMATEELKLNFAINPDIKIGAKGEVLLEHLTSRREDFNTINAWEYQYGLFGQVSLPWDFQFNADLTMYSRRGYSDSSMNTDDLVLNANLSRSFLHKRLTIAIDGFDILGQLSGITRSINGQGRTETWRNVIPNYVMLRCIYKLHIQPKK